MNETITYIGRSKMTFIVTSEGSRTTEVEEFENIDDAIRYFKLAYALGGGSVYLEFDALVEEKAAQAALDEQAAEDAEPKESFYRVDGESGVYFTSPQRCSCPAFVYHG